MHMCVCKCTCFISCSHTNFKILCNYCSTKIMWLHLHLAVHHFEMVPSNISMSGNTIAKSEMSTTLGWALSDIITSCRPVSNKWMADEIWCHEDLYQSGHLILLLTFPSEYPNSLFITFWWNCICFPYLKLTNILAICYNTVSDTYCPTLLVQSFSSAYSSSSLYSSVNIYTIQREKHYRTMFLFSISTPLIEINSLTIRFNPNCVEIKSNTHTHTHMQSFTWSMTWQDSTIIVLTQIMFKSNTHTHTHTCRVSLGPWQDYNYCLYRLCGCKSYLTPHTSTYIRAHACVCMHTLSMDAKME